jgi:excisionase family DNA binding protein
MAHNIEGGEYLTVAEATALMGCTEGWVRMLLRDGKIAGARRIGQRVWVIPAASAREAKGNLSTRSVGKKHLAKRPAAKRKKPKKTSARRK